MIFRAFAEFDGSEPAFFILPLFVGLCIAVIVTTYYKRVHGTLVRQLISRGADCPEKALTLQELGLSRACYRRALFARNSSLRKIVSCVELPPQELAKSTKVKRPAADAQHLYIAPECRDRAERQYDPKGARWGVAILCVLMFAVLAFLSVYFADELINGVKAFVSHYFK